jgi:cbb3-type cytochrome oxidase subunit 3
MTPYQLGSLVGRTLVVFLFFLLIIGGSYYALKRQQLSFRQAISRWWVIALSICFSGIVLLLSAFSLLGTSLQQDASHVYPDAVVSAFRESCVASSTAQLGDAAAQRICTCAITDIQKAYTYGEFKQLNADLQRTGALSTGMTDILTRCSQQ